MTIKFKPHFMFHLIWLVILACNGGPHNNSGSNPSGQIPADTLRITDTSAITLQDSVSAAAASPVMANDALEDPQNKADKNYLLGIIDYSNDKRFILVTKTYVNKPTYLRKETFNAFKKMYEAARKKGIRLTIISGARNFEYQKGIWERKWNSSKIKNEKDRAANILKYSAMPMSSRHHWGTDIDLNDLNNSYFEKGSGLKIYRWLQENAHKYGFCQVYTDKKKGKRTGYEMEKWHWSYMPLSAKFLKEYNASVRIRDIKNFKGSGTAKDLDIIKNYVNGIDNCNL